MPLALVKYGLTRRHPDLPHFEWKADLATTYDVVVLGAGGHGLATAYYLAARHGAGSVAVIDKGVLASDDAEQVAMPSACKGASLHGESIGLFRTLSSELDMNVLYSERGRLELLHEAAALGRARRRAEVMRHGGTAAEILSPDAIARICPVLDLARSSYRPVVGALYDPAGAIVSRDALCWAYARAAMAHGVEIHMRAGDPRVVVQNGRAVGVETSRGRVHAGKVLETGAHVPALLGRTMGPALPLALSAWQVFVSEAVKPVLDPVVVSEALGVAVWQSVRGEIVMTHTPEPADDAPSLAPDLETSLAARVLELLPFLSELGVLRKVAGHADMAADRAPVMGPTPVRDYYVDAGWGPSGLMAAPASGLHMAACLAAGQIADVLAPFLPDRFYGRDPVPEMAVPVAHRAGSAA